MRTVQVCVEVLVRLRVLAFLMPGLQYIGIHRRVDGRLRQLLLLVGEAVCHLLLSALWRDTIYTILPVHHWIITSQLRLEIDERVLRPPIHPVDVALQILLTLIIIIVGVGILLENALGPRLVTDAF